MSLARDTLTALAEVRGTLQHPGIERYMETMVSFRGMTAASVARALRDAATQCEPFFLADRLKPVIEHAGTHVDGLAEFEAHLLPAHSGFLVIEGGIPFLDIRGRRMVRHAMMWNRGMATIPNPAGGTGTIMGISLVEFALLTDMNDEISQELTRDYPQVQSFGRWQPMSVGFVPFGQKIGPEWIEGDPTEDVPNPIATPNGLRWLIGFADVMREVIAVPERETAPPKYAAWLTKRRLPTDVTIVRLRRKEYQRQIEGQGGKWSYRTLIRGHWRWQVCGPDHPLAREVAPGKWRARIFIEPHEAGPEDGPFHLPARVTAVAR